jgi:coenzyme F420-0:L-glutamate ligase / coenzyme F420-1:gamma-L-glutamate ligase
LGRSWDVQVAAVRGIPRIKQGDDLAEVIRVALRKGKLELRDDDILVVTQKVVSKSEGRLVRLDQVTPTEAAVSLGRELGKDPKLVELVLRESKRIVRKGHGVIITETHHGFVCANSGIDTSNVEGGYAALLPVDPDASARKIREKLERSTGKRLAVIITDTFGRPWREGQTDMAIGCSGIEPLDVLFGKKDPYGYVLKVTAPAVVDEVAAAAELVMTKLSMVPVALVRGVKYKRSDSGMSSMVRDSRLDLFK